MKLGDVLELVDGRALTADFDPEYEVNAACGADLMSDVLAFTRECKILLTGLVTAHAVRTAEVAGIPAIIFVRGKIPQPEVIDLAMEKGIHLAATDHTLFEACGRLYSAGIEACDVRGEARRKINAKLRAIEKKALLT